MLTTAIVSFREFLEAFLIVGIFLGVSRKLSLKKEKEIVLAAVVGFLVSFLLNIGVFLFGTYTRNMITEQTADAIESYLQVFSGLFLVYVVFSLHSRMNQGRKDTIARAKESIKQNIFDLSLFFTIIFLIVREGFEIALFTASISLFSVFIQNLIGLVLGFLGASIIGGMTFFAYTKFSIAKVYKVTEYMVVLLGASLFQTGLTKFLETHFVFSLSNIVSFHWQFLPDEDSFIGTLLQSFLGVDKGFSVARLLLMIIYVLFVYVFFFRKKYIQI
jgi:high-affinity iron transporter